MKLFLVVLFLTAQDGQTHRYVLDGPVTLQDCAETVAGIALPPYASVTCEPAE